MARVHLAGGGAASKSTSCCARDRRRCTGGVRRRVGDVCNSRKAKIENMKTGDQQAGRHKDGHSNEFLQTQLFWDEIIVHQLTTI